LSIFIPHHFFQDMNIITEILLEAEKKYQEDKKAYQQKPLDILQILSSYRYVLSKYSTFYSKILHIINFFFNNKRN